MSKASRARIERDQEWMREYYAVRRQLFSLGFRRVYGGSRFKILSGIVWRITLGITKPTNRY